MFGTQSHSAMLAIGSLIKCTAFQWLAHAAVKCANQGSIALSAIQSARSLADIRSYVVYKFEPSVKAVAKNRHIPDLADR